MSFHWKWACFYLPLDLISQCSRSKRNFFQNFTPHFLMWRLIFIIFLITISIFFWFIFKLFFFICLSFFYFPPFSFVSQMFCFIFSNNKFFPLSFLSFLLTFLAPFSQEFDEFCFMFLGIEFCSWNECFNRDIKKRGRKGNDV